MTDSMSSYRNQALPDKDALVIALVTALPIIERNGWLSGEKLEELRRIVPEAKVPTPGPGRTPFTQFLLERKLLTRDQISDLDAIIRHQPTLPEFDLIRKIGAGGMGTVFLAKHLESQRMVALKTINTRLAEDRDFVERFQRESRALSKINHGNVAQILGSGESDRQCWLAMEFIDGPSLMNLLKDYKTLPEHYALHIARQVAMGLDHVHSVAGLVHRDIKPENILVVRGGVPTNNPFPLTDQAKLIDFGLVKSDHEDERLTQTGMTIGTPLYMSPEQVRGEKLDARSDIYGLGATLFHLLTGVTPYLGSSPGAIMSAHLTEAIPDPAVKVNNLHAATRDLVMTSMAKQVEKRYRNFAAFVTACDAAIASLDSSQYAVPNLLRKPMPINKTDRKSGVVEKRSEQVPAVVPPTIAVPEAGSTVKPPARAEQLSSLPVSAGPVELPKIIMPAPMTPPPAPPPPMVVGTSGTRVLSPSEDRRQFQQAQTMMTGDSLQQLVRNQASGSPAQPPADQLGRGRSPSTRTPLGNPVLKSGSNPQAPPKPVIIERTPIRNHILPPAGRTVPSQAPARPVASPANDGSRSGQAVPSQSPTRDPETVAIRRSVSAAYVDPPPSPGMGLLPWMVLGGAIALLVGVVIWAYF